MSTHIYVTFGERSLVMAKPATYQEFKHEIRNHFPMLASVFSIVILWKRDGGMLGHWTEIVDSAYGVIPNGAELYINVAEPITKRYIFPLPDGRNSNVGPPNQVLQTDGMGNAINNTTGSVPSGPQVSIKQPRTSKYHYPGSESSFRFERSVGAACASGWADASERFRRSAKLIPNLKECKEAVGLGVAESNWYPDEVFKTADNKSGHIQHQHYDCCSSACTHDCDCELCRQKQDDKATGFPAASAPDLAAGQHGGAVAINTPGKRFSFTNVNNGWFNSPYRIQPSGHTSPPVGDLAPEEDWAPSRSPQRRWANMPSPHTVTPPYASSWGVDDDAQKEEKGSGYAPPDYILGSPRGSPGSPPTRVSRAGGSGWSGVREEEDHADQQYAHTAVPWTGPHFQAMNAAWTTNMGQDAHDTFHHVAADQVSHAVHRHARDHEAMDWSPPRRQESGHRWSQQPQTQADPHGLPPYYHPPPTGGSFTRTNPAWISTGSPIARFRRSHMPRLTTTDQKRQKRTDAK